MRIAVLSDIHGNFEALKAVLEDMIHRNIDKTICLGDMIGYGPESDKVVRCIRKLDIATIMGNHELGASDPSHLKWFNPTARKTLEKTAKIISKETLLFISKLKPVRREAGCRFVHGFPLESITTYLFAVSEEELFSVFKKMKERICFVGHTHLLECIDFNGTVCRRSPLSRGITRLNKDRQYILNIGSVGQPRDENRDAKYVIYDTDEFIIELRFIPYDIDAVVRKIRAAGLPEANASRLLK